MHSGSAADLDFLADILRSGGLVAVPTETVYGLAAHALDAEACRRIFEAKGRPAYDPLIVHVASRVAADSVATFNAAAATLAERFWPGPLTLILPKKACVPDIVTSGRPTVAVRVPAHPLMRALLESSGLPLAAPSANPFGYISPTTAAHVQAGLGDRIGHILDGGPCTIGVESTIIDVRDATDPVVLRPGGVAIEALAEALGRPVRVHQPAPKPGAGLVEAEAELAPGMLERHYSPRTPLELRAAPFTAADLRTPAPGIVRVCFSRPAAEAAPDVRFLSASGDAAEAARALFALLRDLDGAGFERIVIEPAPPTGLGLAINDRLRRAAAKSART
ncbi:MAG: threonylcarbamoyl-AMP synthase [Opitutaceae bacterium]|nr:threonylcarbamoyl-AMP synthase [Opitutaceae bacterium]